MMWRDCSCRYAEVQHIGNALHMHTHTHTQAHTNTMEMCCYICWNCSIGNNVNLFIFIFTYLIYFLSELFTLFMLNIFNYNTCCVFNICG